MLGNSVGNLVSENDGKAGLVLRDGKKAFIDDNLASRHTEGIYFAVVDEIELPLEVLQFAGIPIVREIRLDSS